MSTFLKTITKYHLQSTPTTDRTLFTVTKNSWNSYTNNLDQKKPHKNLRIEEKYSSQESLQKKQKRKNSNHGDNDKTKKVKKKRVGVKKKRKRKPVVQNSPITYIKLPAQPYSFVKTEGPTSSIYSPKSSSSSYFNENPLQALFKGVFGEADKSGKTNFTKRLNMCVL